MIFENREDRLYQIGVIFGKAADQLQQTTMCLLGQSAEIASAFVPYSPRLLRFTLQFKCFTDAHEHRA